jgi:HD superfamily phosphohydrolase
MDYRDSIYGDFQINEPVLLDLLASPALSRLKGVLQHGITALLGITSPITRYDHTVGVMLLVRWLGGDLREQIAAVLHDVSHTAFSHVIDHVYHDQGTQSYHERQKAWWIERTELPGLLAAHNFDWHDFLDDERFPILEKPLPRLCADRVDYFLRDGTGLNVISPAHVQSIVDHLVTRDGRIAVQDVATARLLGDRFMAADDASWSNPHELVLYELAARAIRTALENRLLTEEDLWGTDAALWAHLHESADPAVVRWVRLTEGQPKFITDLENPTIRIKPKVRAIDPDVVTPDGLMPLSVVDADYRRIREAYVKRKAEGISVRLVG